MDTPASSRDKILETAQALFARRGFEGASMRDLARQVGLGKSSLFHHFETKARLYAAVLERVFQHIESAMDPVLRAEGAPLERLDHSVETLIDALVEQPGTARLLLRGLFEDESFDPNEWAEGRRAEASLDRMLKAFAALLDRGMRDGSFRILSVPDTIQTLIGATVYHFASGEFGRDLFGASLFSSDAIERRKQETKALLRQGICAPDRL